MTGNLIFLKHKHAPSIEPCIGKSSQDFCKAVLADVRDVLEEEPFGFVREFSGGHADDFEEKFAALSLQAPSSPRSADVLACIGAQKYQSSGQMYVATRTDKARE